MGRLLTFHLEKMNKIRVFPHTKVGSSNKLQMDHGFNWKKQSYQRRSIKYRKLQRKQTFENYCPPLHFLTQGNEIAHWVSWKTSNVQW